MQHIRIDRKLTLKELQSHKTCNFIVKRDQGQLTSTNTHTHRTSQDMEQPEKFQHKNVAQTNNVSHPSFAKRSIAKRSRKKQLQLDPYTQIQPRQETSMRRDQRTRTDACKQFAKPVSEQSWNDRSQMNTSGTTKTQGRLTHSDARQR